MPNMSADSNSTPKYFFDLVTDITPEDIKKMGCKAVAVDIDNTTFYDASFRPVKGVRNWVDGMRAEGIEIIIISNTIKLRARIIARMLGKIPYIGSSEKPKTKAFFKAAKMLNIDIKELAMIGDQLFTDIQGANNAGAVSIRIKYIQKEVLFAKKFRRIRRKEAEYLKKKGLEDKI